TEDTLAHVDPGAASATFTYDTSAPVAAVTFPTTTTHYSAAGWTGAVTGTSHDAAGSGTTVNVRVQKDGGANSCYNGTDFTGDCSNANTFLSPSSGTASGTSVASWSLALLAGKLTNGS